MPLSTKQADRDVEVVHKAPEQLNARVLLVEDNDQVRAFTHEILKDLGCTVLLAKDGREAIALLEDTSVEVVVTDVVMPGMSGIELADTIKKRWRDLPVILATGYSDELVEKRPEYPSISKPFTSVHLQEALVSALHP